MNKRRFDTKAYIMFTASVTLFGTIGIFRKHITLPSGFLALTRGVIGTFFLLLLLAARRRKPDRTAIRSNLRLLLLSGAFLGINWILLFEAYRYTTVAIATVCYYMAPVLVLPLAACFLGERLQRRKLLCILAAFGGMILVSGMPAGQGNSSTELKGLLLAFGAAVFYAGLMILNKKIQGVDGSERTVLQLAAAVLVLLPYTICAEHSEQISFTPQTLWLLLIVGILHTGIAYGLYFGAISELHAQTAAVLSYLDPAIAVLLSALVLKEPLHLVEVLGMFLILGAALYSELPKRVRAR